MTQQVFAQFIEMSAASLSSIFNGRTKPTINIVEAIKKKIPDISTDWLMFGVGTMYLKADDNSSPTPERGESNPPTVSSPTESLIPFESFPSTAYENSGRTPQNYNGVRNTRLETVREEVKTIDKPQRRVIEIRVFYDDQTWDTFVPAKK
jgi:DNA-binding XRE family transcriptional regulator